MSFLDILPFLPSSAPARFLRMSPGFIMSGEVQALRSTYVPNSIVQPSAGKVMATVFWDAKDFIIFGIFTQEKYNYCRVLCKLARTAKNRHL